MIWFLTLDWVPKGGWIIGSSGWLIGWGLAENWLLISYFPGPGTACELKARIKVTFKVFLSESLINFVLFLVEHGFVSRSLFVGWTTLYHQGSLTNKIMLAVIMGGGGGGDSHIKVMGMLFLLLRGETCRFWSHFGYPGGNLNIFTYPLVLWIKKYLYKN